MVDCNACMTKVGFSQPNCVLWVFDKFKLPAQKRSINSKLFLCQRVEFRQAVLTWNGTAGICIFSCSLQILRVLIIFFDMNHFVQIMVFSKPFFIYFHFMLFKSSFKIYTHLWNREYNQFLSKSRLSSFSQSAGPSI